MPTVRLTWTDPNSGAAQEDEFRVYRSTSPFDEDSLPSILATLAVDTVTYDDTTVLDGISYYYAVAAVKGANLRIAFTGPAEVGAVYVPLSEPAPNAAMLTEYNTAAEVAYDWSTLTGFNHSGVQISGDRLYGVSGANPSAAMLPFAVGPTETVRLTLEVERVAGSSASIYVGFSTQTTPAAGMPGSIMAGFNSLIANYVGSGISTATRFTRGAGSTVSGLYTITAVATPETISITIRRPDNSVEGAVCYNRSAMPNIASLVFWNQDSRGLSGHNIRAFGVKRSLTPFRTKSISGQTFEGNAGQVIYIGASSAEATRIHVPKGAVGSALPICLVCHAVSRSDESIYAQSEERAVLTALENAGYIVVSINDGANGISNFRWGNATSITKHLDVVSWIRDRMYASGLVVLTMSGGTVVGHNLITRRQIHARGIYSVCGVFDMPEFYADQASYQAGMNGAYGATDLASFTANSNGFVPSDAAAGAAGIEYTGKRVRFSIATGDATVNNAKHANVMQPLVLPRAVEAGVLSVAGGHLVAASFNPTDIVDFFDRCF